MSTQNPSFGVAPRAARLPGGWTAQVGPFAILAGVGIYLRSRWDDIPTRFPVHWGIDGQPNGWSARTVAGVYGPLLLGTAIIALIAISSFAISRLRGSTRSVGTSSVASEFAHRISIFLLIVEYFLAAIFSLVGFLPLTGSPGVMPVLIVTGAFLLALIFLMAWSAKAQGQGTTRGPAPIAMPSESSVPEKHWKLGIFYFNKDDSALLVEKRFGVGYTLNFAHPSAWICMAVVLLLPVAILLLVLHQR